MQVIKIDDLHKTFKTYKRKKGFIGSIQTLFTKEYITVNAVDGVSFGVDQGEIVGYVGPNGAGKSTTIKMLTGILYPTSGVIEVCGLVPTKDRKQNLIHIGVVFGQRTQLWWDLPLIESFELLRHIYRVPEKIYKDNIAIFAELLDINEFINTPVRLLIFGAADEREILQRHSFTTPTYSTWMSPQLGLMSLSRKKLGNSLRK